MRIVWLRPGTANGFQCENCLRDQHLLSDLSVAGHIVHSLPVYLPLSEKERTPVLYGAIRMWLGTAWPVLQKLPDVFNALLDHHGLLSQIARRAQTSDPSKGAAMTLATLNGHYDPRLDAELFDAIDGIGETPEAILISTPLLAHQGRIAHDCFNVPWYSLIGGEDHWVDELGEGIKERVWELMRTESESCSAFITCGQTPDQRIVDELRLDTQRCVTAFPGC
ncbi:MAG: hypothetical protein WCJ02_05930 [bacterium]